jgi:hypothetical protein
MSFVLPKAPAHVFILLREDRRKRDWTVKARLNCKSEIELQKRDWTAKARLDRKRKIERERDWTARATLDRRSKIESEQDWTARATLDRREIERDLIGLQSRVY